MADDRFEVQFRFDGGLATSGKLDGSDHEVVTSAVRRLLAVHAHCFLHRKVPVAAFAEGRGYHVQHAGSSATCHVDHWEIVLGVSAIGSSDRPEEVKGAIAGCVSFLQASLRSVVTGELNDAEFFEPASEESKSDAETDKDVGLEAIRRELQVLTARVLYEGVARPIGRSAEALSITINGEQVIAIDDNVKTRLFQHNITLALKDMRSRGVFERNLSRERISKPDRPAALN